ncbi:MAG: DNA topoisomerase IV [Eudoraea sp.]|nr:DNA topoisomerase IV [Eudoraea sp.]
MLYKIMLLLFSGIMLGSCYQPKRECQSFKDGTFTFESIIDGKATTTTFTRNGDLEIDYYSGKADTSSIRWINDCEFIATKLRPKNNSEEQAIHMKILSTTDNSYTFEYSRIGDSRKLRGTAIKTAP